MMTRLINEAPLHRREGIGGACVPKALFPGDLARWPLSRHKSLLAPPATRTPSPLAPGGWLSNMESELAHLARRSPRSPRILWSPHLLREEGGLTPGDRRAPGLGAGACLPCKVLGNSRAITGPRRFPGADCTAGARIRERAAGAAQGGERKSPGICLVITWHKALGGVCHLCATAPVAGWGISWGASVVRSPVLGRLDPGAPGPAPRRDECETGRPSSSQHKAGCILPASAVSPKGPSPATWGRGGGGSQRESISGDQSSRLASVVPSHSLCKAGSLGEPPDSHILSLRSSASRILPLPLAASRSAWESDQIPDDRHSRRNNNKGKKRNPSLFF